MYTFPEVCDDLPVGLAVSAVCVLGDVTFTKAFINCVMFV